MPDWVPLNTRYLLNPVNWVIVTLMLMIAGLALQLLMPRSPAIPNPMKATV